MFSIKLNFISAGKAQLLEPLKTEFGEVHKSFLKDIRLSIIERQVIYQKLTQYSYNIFN